MKKALGALFTLAGAFALIIGVVGIFGANLVQGNPWVYAILGLIFFLAGIGLVKTIRSTE